MVLINFKKESNIPTFSRARKGWAKRITGLNKEQANGYSLEGEFVNLGNFDTNLLDGIYIDCSKKANSDGEVEKTYHLFTVTDGSITLLQTESDCKGWAVKFWGNIENYLNKDGLTAESLVNLLKERTNDESLLQEVAKILVEDSTEKGWTEYCNPHQLNAIMSHLGVLSMDDKYYCERNTDMGKMYEKGVELLKNNDGGIFEKKFYNDAHISNLKPKIVAMLDIFHNIFNEDFSERKIKLEVIDLFQEPVNFSNWSDISKYEDIFNKISDVGFYSLVQVWTNTWKVRKIMVFHYNEKDRTLFCHIFGAYFHTH